MGKVLTHTIPHTPTYIWQWKQKCTKKMPESFYSLAISGVFRENTSCVRNRAMIGRIPPLLSTGFELDGCRACIQFVADSQNPMGSKCQGTRFEISWYRTSCCNNLLQRISPVIGGCWRQLDLIICLVLPGLRRVQMFFAQ